MTDGNRLEAIHRCYDTLSDGWTPFLIISSSKAREVVGWILL